MSDRIWYRLCALSVPGRCEPAAARARADLAAAWSGLSVHERDGAICALGAENDCEVLARLKDSGPAALYRAAIGARGVAILIASSLPATPQPQQKKWGGAPLEYEHDLYDQVLESLTACPH